jgi:hypothetical protein
LFVFLDIIFFIYLYQRYIYPVDRTRLNEYGTTGETDGPVVNDSSQNCLSQIEPDTTNEQHEKIE